jgi:hypothetical protein
MKPPTGPELYGKIRNAIRAIQAGRCNFGTLRHWAGDREFLGLEKTEELWDLLPELLGEILQLKPDKCYAGSRPPQRCYQAEPLINKQSLWAFAWDSERLEKRVYLKFVLKKNESGEWHYFHIDCHQSDK